MYEFESFKEASIQAKAARLAQNEGTNGKVKIMFAQSEQQAEDLLCQVRVPGPLGDE
jgi:hypothetical protein